MTLQLEQELKEAKERIEELKVDVETSLNLLGGTSNALSDCYSEFLYLFYSTILPQSARDSCSGISEVHRRFQVAVREGATPRCFRCEHLKLDPGPHCTLFGRSRHPRHAVQVCHRLESTDKAFHSFVQSYLGLVSRVDAAISIINIP